VVQCLQHFFKTAPSQSTESDAFPGNQGFAYPQAGLTEATGEAEPVETRRETGKESSRRGIRAAWREGSGRKTYAGTAVRDRQEGGCGTLEGKVIFTFHVGGVF